MRRFSWVIPALTAAGLATDVGSARANDIKIYPGIMCQEEDGDLIGDIQRAAGVTYNESTTTDRTVRCPIVRDNTLDNTPNSFSVHVRDYGATRLSCAVCCASSTSGNYCVSGSTSSTGEDVEILMSSGAPSNCVDGGAYYMYCEIPHVYSGAWSGINRYELEES